MEEIKVYGHPVTPRDRTLRQALFTLLDELEKTRDAILHAEESVSSLKSKEAFLAAEFLGLTGVIIPRLSSFPPVGFPYGDPQPGPITRLRVKLQEQTESKL